MGGGLLLYLVITPPQKDGASLPNSLTLAKQVFISINLPYLNSYLVLYIFKFECWFQEAHSIDFEFTNSANFDWFIDLRNLIWWNFYDSDSSYFNHQFSNRSQKEKIIGQIQHLSQYTHSKNFNKLLKKRHILCFVVIGNIANLS